MQLRSTNAATRLRLAAAWYRKDGTWRGLRRSDRDRADASGRSIAMRREVSRESAQDAAQSLRPTPTRQPRQQRRSCATNESSSSKQVYPEGVSGQVCAFRLSAYQWKGPPPNSILPGLDLPDSIGRHYHGCSIEHCVTRGHLTPDSRLVAIEIFTLSLPKKIDLLISHDDHAVCLLNVRLRWRWRASAPEQRRRLCSKRAATCEAARRSANVCGITGGGDGGIRTLDTGFARITV
jgi:hypothetical protein